ncbi:MAG: AAA family ATPase [Parachlamydiaceae bacterium]
MLKKKELRKSGCPLVIGISGISGAGKSTLMRKLSKTLQATKLFWDDYDEISQASQDYVEWFYSGKDYNAWDYPKLVDTLRTLKNGERVICPATGKELSPSKYILFDAPLGYCHQATGKLIDFLVCLDTPLDIALARRLIRDYQGDSNAQKMVNELQEYLSKSRPLFTLSSEEKTSDLLLDGNLSLNEQEKQVLNALTHLG